MKILKKIAKYILRTELQTLQTRIDEEVKISKDLKEHFKKKTTPIDFYKVLEEGSILVEDLMMLKPIYVLLKRTEDSNFKQIKILEKQLNKELEIYPEGFIEIEEIKKQNQETLDRLIVQRKALEKIISKLSGIID